MTAIDLGRAWIARLVDFDGVEAGERATRQARSC